MSQSLLNSQSNPNFSPNSNPDPNSQGEYKHKKKAKWLYHCSTAHLCMLFPRLSFALSVFQPWNNSACCVADALPRLTRQCYLYLRGLNSVNTVRVYHWRGRQSFGASTSLCMNRSEKINKENTRGSNSNTPLQQVRRENCRQTGKFAWP